MPGDLHKLWRTRDPKGYHVEYGYSCMGYEIAGGLGVKLAAPEREVYVMVGDGSYLMMAQEIVTAVQEGVKLDVVLVDNHGFASIGALSRVASARSASAPLPLPSDAVDGDLLPVDLAANAASLGAHVAPCEQPRRARGGAARGARRPAHDRRADRDRPAGARARAPRPGGTCRSPRSPRLGLDARRPRRPTSENKQTQQQYLRPATRESRRDAPST